MGCRATPLSPKHTAFFNSPRPQHLTMTQDPRPLPQSSRAVPPRVGRVSRPSCRGNPSPDYSCLYTNCVCVAGPCCRTSARSLRAPSLTASISAPPIDSAANATATIGSTTDSSLASSWESDNLHMEFIRVRWFHLVKLNECDVVLQRRMLTSRLAATFRNAVVRASRLSPSELWPSNR